MGLEPPVDVILASLVAFLTASITSPLIALVHRGRATGVRLALALSVIATLGSISFFSRPGWEVFDASHPKRLPVLYMQNLSSTPPTFSLHVATLDRAGGFETLIGDIASHMSLDASAAVAETMGQEVPDWDIVCERFLPTCMSSAPYQPPNADPVSQFLRSYKLPVPASADAEKRSAEWRSAFTLEATASKLDVVRRRRSLTLTIRHPAIIWTVVAFSADIVAWDLPSLPQRGVRRHHIKEASGFGVDEWTLKLDIQLSEAEFEAAQRNDQRRKGQREGRMEQQGQLRIDYSGYAPSLAFKDVIRS